MNSFIKIKLFLKILQYSKNTSVGVSFLRKKHGFRPATFLKIDTETFRL